MPEIDVRLDTGELDLSLALHTERSTGPELDIRFARGLLVQGSPDAYREFAHELLDLVDATCPPARNVLADIPVHDGLDELAMGYHVIVTTDGEQRIEVGQSCTSWENATDSARSIRVPQVAVGADLLIDFCQGFDLKNPDPRAGQTLNLGEVLSTGAVPDPFKAPEVQP